MYQPFLDALSRILGAPALPRGCVFNCNTLNSPKKGMGREGGKASSREGHPEHWPSFLQPMGVSSTSAVFGMKTQVHTPALPKMRWAWMKISPHSSLRTQQGRPVSALLPLSSSLSWLGLSGGKRGDQWTRATAADHDPLKTGVNPYPLCTKLGTEGTQLWTDLPCNLDSSRNIVEVYEQKTEPRTTRQFQYPSPVVPPTCCLNLCPSFTKSFIPCEMPPSHSGPKIDQCTQ